MAKAIKCGKINARAKKKKNKTIIAGKKHHAQKSKNLIALKN